MFSEFFWCMSLMNKFPVKFITATLSWLKKIAKSEKQFSFSTLYVPDIFAIAVKQDKHLYFFCVNAVYAYWLVANMKNYISRKNYFSTLSLCFRNILAYFIKQRFKGRAVCCLVDKSLLLQKRALFWVTCPATCSAFVTVLFADWLLSSSPLTSCYLEYTSPAPLLHFFYFFSSQFVQSVQIFFHPQGGWKIHLRWICTECTG